MLLAAGALVALAACSPAPTSGIVEHRQYSSAYSYNTYPCLVYTTTRTRIGSTVYTSTSCAAYGLHVNHRPAVYGLCLKHDKPGESDGCFDTDQVTYDRYPEGTHYP